MYLFGMCTCLQKLQDASQKVERLEEKIENLLEKEQTDSKLPVVRLESEQVISKREAELERWTSTIELWFTVNSKWWASLCYLIKNKKTISNSLAAFWINGISHTFFQFSLSLVLVTFKQTASDYDSVSQWHLFVVPFVYILYIFCQIYFSIPS